MKDYIKPVIIAIAVLLLAVFIIEKACPGSDAEYQKLKGEFKVLDERAKEREEEDKQIIITKDKEIEILKNNNKVIDRERLDLKKKDDNSQEKIYRLERDRELLTDKDSVIANLDQQVKEWKVRFWGERADKDKANLLAKNWAFAYYKENQIRKMLERQLADQKALTKVGEEIAKEGEKQSRGLSLKLNLKNVLYTGVGFGLGYLLGATK